MHRRIRWGADLIAHGGAADLPEVLSNCLKGAGIKTELDDGYDVVDVQVVHVGLVAKFGLVGVDVAKLLAVAAVNVHVIVVAVLVLLDEVGDATQDVLLGDGVEEATRSWLRNLRSRVTFSRVLFATETW